MSINPADYASASALVRGAETHLRSALLFDDLPGETVGKFIGRGLAPGRPPPRFGQWFAVLSWGGARGGDPDPQSWDTYHGLVVTLTARLSYAPKDRQGIRVTTPGELYDLAGAFAGPNVVHGSWELIAAANRFVPGTKENLVANGATEEDAEAAATVNGFCETLVLESVGKEREESAQWIGAKDGDGVYVIDIRFKDARHLKPYEG